MEKEKNRTPTAADLVIIILIIALGFIVYRYAFASSGEDTFEIDYTVKVSAIRSELSDKVKAGDDVYSSDGAYMGRVISCSPVTAVLGTTGQTLPGMSDLYITIEAEATGDRVVGWYEIYAERELELYTAGLYFECVCISVR